MTAQDYIPAADKAFSEWVANFIAYVAIRIGKWSIDESVFTPVQALATAYAITYKLASEPATRTSGTILAKTIQKKELIKAIRYFVRFYVANNPAVTDVDRKDAGLTVPKDTRTPVPDPSTSPEFSIDTSHYMRLTIHFYDEESKLKAKPPGVHGCEIRWAILEAPPVSNDDLVHSSFDTRTPFVLNFDRSQRGKTVYMCLCWENTRGAKGPWSELKDAIIP